MFKGSFIYVWAVLYNDIHVVVPLYYTQKTNETAQKTLWMMNEFRSVKV